MNFTSFWSISFYLNDLKGFIDSVFYLDTFDAVNPQDQYLDGMGFSFFTPSGDPTIPPQHFSFNFMGGEDGGGSGSQPPDYTANANVFTEEGFLNSILHVSIGQFTTAIERLADARAENGAETSRLRREAHRLRSGWRPRS